MITSPVDTVRIWKRVIMLYFISFGTVLRTQQIFDLEKV